MHTIYITKFTKKKTCSFSVTESSSDQLCLSLLMSYISEHGKTFPLEIGVDYTDAQRRQLADYLVNLKILQFSILFVLIHYTVCFFF